MPSTRGQLAAIAGVIDRQRLYHILDSPVVRVCVLQGPRGCGKTTLLRSWTNYGLPHREIVWVSLGPAVTDRQAFWQQVSLSIAARGNTSGGVTEWLQEQYRLTSDPVAVAQSAVGRGGPMVLVLDAYEHLVEAAELIDKDLARLMAMAPTLRLIVASSSPTTLVDIDPPGGIARVVTHSEMAFTPKEVQHLIEAQTGLNDKFLAGAIIKATRGFALTVKDAVLMLSQLGRIPHDDSAEWSAMIGSRLESLLPDSVAVQFVTDTSIPPYVDLELGVSLSGNEQAAALFKTLERNGLGRWTPYSGNRQVFQYVEVIRDTFRARAMADPERFERSCRTTVTWLLANEGVVDQALLYAIDGKDYELADRVSLSLMITNPDSYLSDRLLVTLRMVPGTELAARPMLAFGLALAMSSNLVFHTVTPQIAKIAAQSMARPQYLESTIDAISLAGMRSVCYRMMGDFDRAADEAQKVLGYVDGMDMSLTVRYGEYVGAALREAGYSLLLRGRIDRAIEASTRSIALCLTPTARNYSAVTLMGTAAFIGDMACSELVAATFLDQDKWPQAPRETSLRGRRVIAQGLARLDALDFLGAIKALQQIDPSMRTSILWAQVATISVVARHGLGQGAAEARRVIKEMGSGLPRSDVAGNVTTEYLSGTLALVLLADGEDAEAGHQLDGLPKDSPYLASARIAHLLSCGDDREALFQARILIDLPGHTIRTLAEAQTIGAVAALRQGEQDQAWSWLIASALAWETYGPRLHVIMLAPPDRRVLWEFGRQRDSAILCRYLDIPVVEARETTPTEVSLTKRERIVLEALAKHNSNRDIAKVLLVSPHTVKTQLQSVYRKLGVSSRHAALAAANELGIVDLEPSRLAGQNASELSCCWKPTGTASG